LRELSSGHTCGIRINHLPRLIIAFQKGRVQGPDDGRHFGLVVTDKEAVRAALSEADIAPLPGPFLDFLDPWGNRIEIVEYQNVQFTKASNVLRGMGLRDCQRTTAL
jgi:lactoylglutathione lyase